MKLAPGPSRIRVSLALGSAVSIALVTLAGCGSSEAPTLASTSGPTLSPTANLTVPPTATPTSGAILADTPRPTQTPTPLQAGPGPSPAPDLSSTLAEAPVFDEQREIGQVEGISFMVTDGSEVTFKVKEQLARLPLPNDAVVRTRALSGVVRLDGGESIVQIDLHRLSSDNSFRDRWIRNRMFPDDPIATFTLSDVGSLPQGFARGDVVEAQVTGTLNIFGIDVPLTFAIEARDDGHSVFILGRTSFTWADFGLPRPSAMLVVSIEDEVRVEVLISVKPLAASPP